jgi:predicted PurR-regulated permease PerM
MKKKKSMLILLSLCVIAGVVSGTYFFYFTRFCIPFIFAVILCYAASVNAAVIIYRYRKGITGKRLNRARITAVILGIPLALCTVVTILDACGVGTIIPKAMTSVNWHTEFSFQEDIKSIDMDSPLVKTEGFVNVDEAETELSFYNNEPIERAKQELGDDSRGILSCTRAYDKTEDVWRIEFNRQDSVTHYAIRFATVYLTGKGITLLIVYDE